MGNANLLYLILNTNGWDSDLTYLKLGHITGKHSTEGVDPICMSCWLAKVRLPLVYSGCSTRDTLYAV